MWEKLIGTHYKQSTPVKVLSRVPVGEMPRLPNTKSLYMFTGGWQGHTLAPAETTYMHKVARPA